MLARLQQACELHGEGRTSGNDMAARRQLNGGAPERDNVDTVMLVEALVLVGEQQPEEPRIDIFHRDRQPPAPLAGGIGAQQPALPIEHHM